MNRTLFKYILNMQLKAMIFVSFFVFCLIFLFDFAEVTRKFPISSVAETAFAIKLSFLRVPITFFEILHYIYFITATFSLWNLCRSNQITILKSTGKSPQQILYPFVSFAFFIALIWLFIVQPVGKISESYYNKNVSSDIVKHDVNENIWIDYKKENKIIFVKKISNKMIEGLYVFNIKTNERIFAKQAIIKDDIWTLYDVTIINQNKVNNIQYVEKMMLLNNISYNLIKILAKPPKNHNIYQLYTIYSIQEYDKVLLGSYELELHKLLANCANFILFSLIAAIICFPINRYKTKTNIAIKVISSAIILRFLDNMLESLSYSGVVPVRLASWGAVLILIFISTAILVWREV